MAEQVTFAQILNATANAEGVTVAALEGPGRTKSISWPRQRAIYLSRTLRPDLSLTFIGHRLNRDHTTVLHGERRVGDRLVETEGAPDGEAQALARIAALLPIITSPTPETRPMARQSKKRSPRRVAEQAWMTDHKSLFSLAREGWIEPRRVRVTKTSPLRRTYEARFIAGDGAPVVLKTRVAVRPDGTGEILEETMSMRFFVPSRGGKA